jgi:hypothetical protein
LVNTYYRRLVAYYIGKARLWHGEAMHWAGYAGRNKGDSILAERRVKRCCSTIRRLRARAEQAERERDEARAAELLALSWMKEEDR